jgi:hypothetical protein
MKHVIKLRNQIEELDIKIKPFDDLIKKRSKKHDSSHISNNAMLVWSSHEEFLDCNELDSYRTLAHERLLLSQKLESIQMRDLIENRKEVIQIKRTLRKSGVKIDDGLMTCELRKLISK